MPKKNSWKGQTNEGRWKIRNLPSTVPHPEERPGGSPVPSTSNVVNPEERPGGSPVPSTSNVVNPEERPGRSPVPSTPNVVNPEERPGGSPVPSTSNVVNPEERPGGSPVPSTSIVVNPEKRPGRSPVPSTPNVVNPEDRPEGSLVPSMPNVVTPEEIPRGANSILDIIDDPEEEVPKGWKNYLRSFFKKMDEYQPDENSVWIQAARRSKMDYIRMAAKPKTHIVERGAWLTFFGVSVYYAIIWIIEYITKFEKEPVLFVFFGDIPLENVPFPGVTICPLHMFLKSMLDTTDRLARDIILYGTATWNNITFNQTEITELYHVEHHICELGQSFSKMFRKGLSDGLDWFPEWAKSANITIFDDPENPLYRDKILPFIREGLVSLTSVIVACVWTGGTHCEALFRSSKTEMGACFSFNRISDKELRSDKGLQWILKQNNFTTFLDEDAAFSKWMIDDHNFLRINNQLTGTRFDDHSPNTFFLKEEIPRFQKVAGKRNGLSLLLVNSVTPDEVACPLYDGVGYKVLVHSPIEEPNILDKGIVIPLNFEVLVDVTARVTFSSEDLRHMKPDVKRCYLEDESPLKLYKKYTQGNCRRECLTNLILETCGCYQLTASFGGKKKICGVHESPCVKQIFNLLQKFGFDAMCKRYPYCYLGCTEVDYTAKASYAAYPEGFDFPEMFNVSANKSHGSNILHVFMSSPTVEAQKRHVKYDRSEKIGIIGGILGMTNGLTGSGILQIIAGLIVGCLGFFKWTGWFKGDWTKGWKCWPFEEKRRRTKSRKRRRRRNTRKNVTPAPRAVTQVRPRNPQTRVHILDPRRNQQNRSTGAPNQLHHI